MGGIFLGETAMSISSTVRKAGSFTGSGTASVFAFPYKVFQKQDLAVVILAVRIREVGEKR
jgi:hypothetical protein